MRNTPNFRFSPLTPEFFCRLGQRIVDGLDEQNVLPWDEGAQRDEIQRGGVQYLASCTLRLPNLPNATPEDSVRGDALHAYARHRHNDSSRTRIPACSQAGQQGAVRTAPQGHRGAALLQ